MVDTQRGAARRVVPKVGRVVVQHYASDDRIILNFEATSKLA